jgi:hypothetical protein
MQKHHALFAFSDPGKSRESSTYPAPPFSVKGLLFEKTLPSKTSGTQFTEAPTDDSLVAPDVYRTKSAPISALQETEGSVELDA